MGECTALFSWHQREALDEADTLEVTIASAECANCGGDAESYDNTQQPHKAYKRRYVKFKELIDQLDRK